MVKADLIIDVSVDDVTIAEQSWQAFREEVRRSDQRPRPLPASDAWNWIKKFDAKERDELRFLAVKCDGEIQGLLCLALKARARKTPETRDKFLLYVEYLETSPWNQLSYAGSRARFGRVGTALLYAAIQLSMLEGCGGALGLHSLPEAEEYYRSLSFDDFGPDHEEQRLRYFELAPQQAAILIEGEGNENS